MLERIKNHRWDGNSLLGKDLLTADDKMKLQGYLQQVAVNSARENTKRHIENLSSASSRIASLRNDE